MEVIHGRPEEVLENTKETGAAGARLTNAASAVLHGSLPPNSPQMC